MGREKRKALPENRGGICDKKTKKDDATTAAPEEEPTDEEVEEFYVILRRMKQAAEYFGLKRGMSPNSLRAVVAAASDREDKEQEEKEETPPPEVKIDAAGVKRRAKGKEVVEENGLRLDLNLAVAVESDGR